MAIPAPQSFLMDKPAPCIDHGSPEGFLFEPIVFTTPPPGITLGPKNGDPEDGAMWLAVTAAFLTLH